MSSENVLARIDRYCLMELAEFLNPCFFSKNCLLECDDHQ